MKLMRRLASEESGQSMVEYALLALLIAIVVAPILPSVGAAVSKIFAEAAAGFL